MKSNPPSSRTGQEHILLTMSFGSALAILPFAVTRLFNHDWFVGLIDSMMIVGMLMIGSYVAWSRDVRNAGLMLSIVSLGGMCAVVYIKGITLIYWAYPTMVGMYFVISPRLAMIFCLVASLILVPVLVSAMELVQSIAVIMTLIVNNLFAYIFANRMHKQSEELASLVLTDPLTNIGNRRAFNEKINDVMAIVKRSQNSMSVIVVDVDFFKQINDNYGHAAGDRVLIKLVSTISLRIRETDSCYRIGGEEFLVLATNANIEGAKNIADDLRKEIETSSWIENKTITASFGVAELMENETANAWIERADKALYKAKKNGRNRVCLAESS
ncbi:MAG: GGDEF domain-containing protein [Gammaproteobacteria bacterium]|nr:GGDEF domain-containing protein [Gammaproteobacteria bacterium]MCW8988674.1 GGDEF domain-containing protein [Gammaproteobacteria bacterium]